MRIAMVAGELSGDNLGAGLIKQLAHYYPQAQFEGIGGENMCRLGFKSYVPMETLSVMGLVEVIRHYPQIKAAYNELYHNFMHQPPDIFIGIDAPDFNLRLAKALRKASIPTVQYVAPSVWAWREYRIKHIRAACDLVLTLFPFETEFYQQKQLAVRFVGHPLADQIPLYSDQHQARLKLGLNPNNTWVAILPGSRLTELKQLAKPFIQTALWLQQRQPEIQFMVPLPNSKLATLFRQQWLEYAPRVPFFFYSATQAQTVMAASDVVLLASGTATLEAMLIKRPMVVAYRLMPLTYYIAKALIKVPYISLPNLLAGQQLVPEYLQQQVTPANLGASVLNWLEQSEAKQQLMQNFHDLHLELKQAADYRAAQAVIDLLNQKGQK